MRRRRSLDGVWEICADSDSAPVSDETPPTDGWQPAAVPCPWQVLPDAGLPAFGAAWYRRAFDVDEVTEGAPEDPGGHELTHVLLFEASNRTTQVWVDGVEVARHVGGDLPFEASLGRLRPGRHDILVRVQLPDDGGRPGEPSFGEIPHGKQSWYGPVGGLWRSVALETRSAAHLHRVRCRADGERGIVHIHAERTVAADAGLQVVVEDPSGQVVATASRSHIEQSEELAVEIDRPLRWSPGRPQTYLVRVRLLGDSGDVLDEVCQRVGFRVVALRDRDILLDDHPVELRGVLDQDYWPDTDWTAASDSKVEQQLRWVRDAGFNLLRYHVKVPSRHYLDVADRLGMMVWLELPNWRDFTRHTAAEARLLLEEMVDQLGRHPCVVAWSVVNESWGVDLGDNRQREWVADAVAWLRDRPEGWLVVDNSPCHPNGHLDTDLEDYHFYAGLPDHKERWDRFLKEFVQGDAPTYEQGHHPQGRPLVLSEFGFWSLPSAAPADGPVPNPRTGHGPSWGNDIAEPAALLSRFDKLHLGHVFGDYASLADATQRHQSEALRYAVASLRRASVGYAVTELSDVYWEANGLLDQWRRPKAGMTALARVNGDVAVLLHPGRWAYWSGEELEVEVTTVGAPPDAQAHLHVDGTTYSWPPREPLHAPQVSEARRSILRATLQNPEGDILATDEVGFTAFPRPGSRSPTPVPLATIEPQIARALSVQGWSPEESLGADSVWFVSQLDGAATEHLRGGGIVVLLATGPEALGPLCWSFPLIDLTATSGFDSDWMLRTSWLRRDGAFGHIPGGPLLGWEFTGLIPDFGFSNLFASEYRHSVHSASTMGWLHHPVTTLATRRVGRGTVVLCTWQLADEGAGATAIRGAVLDGVVALALSCEHG